MSVFDIFLMHSSVFVNNCDNGVRSNSWGAVTLFVWHEREIVVDRIFIYFFLLVQHFPDSSLVDFLFP